MSNSFRMRPVEEFTHLFVATLASPHIDSRLLLALLALPVCKEDIFFIVSVHIELLVELQVDLVNLIELLRYLKKNEFYANRFGLQELEKRASPLLLEFCMGGEQDSCSSCSWWDQ